VRAVEEARGALSLVRRYAREDETETARRFSQLFSEAETEFLLGSYDRCAAILSALVDVPTYRNHPTLPAALYYLGDAASRTGTPAEGLARLREAAQLLPPGTMAQDALARLITLSDRLGDPRGVDDAYARLGGSSDAREELPLAYAGWMARRPDVPEVERLQRADAVYATVGAEHPSHAEALLLRAAIRARSVEILQRRRDPSLDGTMRRLLEEATTFEQKLADGPAKATQGQRREARLGLARLLVELGRLDDAAQRYEAVAAGDPAETEALLELADVRVRQDRPEEALRAAETLLSRASSGPLATDARLLQANLRLKFGRFDDATRSFEEVSRESGPVADQLGRLLARPDAESWLDGLLDAPEGRDALFDAAPPEARPLLAEDRTLDEARAVAAGLVRSREGLGEARKIGDQLLSALEDPERSLFPQLLQGATLAGTLSNRLALVEDDIVEARARSLAGALPPEERAALATALDARRAVLDELRTLPRDDHAVQLRKRSLVDGLAPLGMKLFATSEGVAQLRRTCAELPGLWASGRSSRSIDPGLEAERLQELDEAARLVAQLSEAHERLHEKLEAQRAAAAVEAVGGGEAGDLRRRHAALLAKAASVVTTAAARGAPHPLDAALRDVDALQVELDGLAAELRERTLRKASELRREVDAQLAALEGRLVVGRTGASLLRRTRARFALASVRGDVGVVDVAWERKRATSDRIGHLGRDEEAQLKALDARWSEVRDDAP
jgi:tetratricopeptide (TPR) repeat protein